MRTARSWHAVLPPRMTWWKRSSGRENDRSLVKHTGGFFFCLGGGDEDLVGGRTTHLRHMLVKMGSSCPNIRGEHKKSVSNHQRVQMVLKGRKGFRPFFWVAISSRQFAHRSSGPPGGKSHWFEALKVMVWHQKIHWTHENDRRKRTNSWNSRKNPLLSRNKKHGG